MELNFFQNQSLINIVIVYSRQKQINSP